MELYIRGVETIMFHIKIQQKRINPHKHMYTVFMEGENLRGKDGNYYKDPFYWDFEKNKG